MANSRDITLDLVGRDHTGHATRSAAGNLDQLKRRMGKFNVETEAGLKRSFVRSGLASASAFAQSFVKMASGGLLGGSGAVAKALTTNPYFAAAGVAVGLAFAAKLIAVAGDAILAGLPLVLAAGIAAIPFVHLWKTQESAVNKLKGKWKGFQDFVSKPMKSAFLDVLKEIGTGLDRLKVPFGNLVAALGPALKPFTKGAFDGITAFIDALAPAMPGITAGLKTWGEKLPGIGKAFGDMFAKILKDPDRVVTAVSNIASIIEGLITVMGWAVRAATMLGDGIEIVSRAITTSFYTMAIGSLKALSSLLDGWAKLNPLMRGPAAAVHGILAGVQSDFQATKDKWTATQRGIARQVIVAKLRADKTDLEAKVEAAKRKLKDPNLTKERKAKIKAEIKAAQAAIETIKGQLRGLDGTVANTYVNVHRNVSSKDAAAGPARPSGKGAGTASWQGAAGGWTSRSEPPRVVLGNTYNDTRVFLDSREIRSVARTTVMDETRRAASRARVGRR